MFCKFERRPNFERPDSTPDQSIRTIAKNSAAFALTEVLFSVGAFGLSSAVALALLLQVNTHAAVARMKTLASIAALNQAGLVRTDGPFSPADDQIPVDLEVGTQSAPIVIYDDPNSETAVMGVMTTTISDPDYWQNSNNLHLRRITVTIQYQFRNRNYSVTMHTMRAADV